ncbi:hypothetical protein ACOME3_006594 [Neoechinorhynchus agilis]
MTMRVSPVVWTFYFIFSTRRIVCLISWVAAGIACIFLAILAHVQKWKRAQSRKTFHLAASVVFSVGLMVDVELLTISSAVLFGVLVLMEAMRLQQHSMIGSYLVESLFALFSNNEDRTQLEISPITLLGGLSYPLIFPSSQRRNISTRWLLGKSNVALFAGVLSTGIGDSFAALIGSTYGTHHWPGSERTLEGTASGFISQILFCALVLWPAGIFSGIQSGMRDILSLMFLFAGLFTSSITETIVSNEYDDNIVVPICTYPLLKLC